MRRQLTIAATLVVLIMLAAGVYSAAEASAASFGKAHRYRVIKRARTYDVVRGHHRTLVVRDHQRYVRVRGVARYRVARRARQFVALRKVRAATRVSLPGAVISTGLPAWASSASDGRAADAANDGDATTRWVASSGSYPQSWTVDLGEARTVSGVGVSWYRSGRRAYRYRIQTSLDGAAFETIVDRSGNQLPGVASHAVTVTTRYVRIEVLGASPLGAWAAACEVTVHAETEPLVPPGATPAPTPTPGPTPLPTPLPPAAADPIKAISSARAGDVVVVGSGTFVSPTTLTIPDGVTIVGQGINDSHISGGVTFGSNSVVRDIKLGAFGFSTRNRDGATNTLFERVRFRGGGGSSPNQNVLQLGGTGSCNHITFRDCEIERNMITDATKAASETDKQYCNIAVMARVSGSRVDSVTFDGCHVGVSNGRTDVARNTGSPFAGLVCWTANTSGTATYSNILIKDCVFEVCDWDNIDLADYRAGTVSGPVTVKGCTLKGAGTNTLCIEGPKGVVVENNLIQRSRYNTFALSPRGATTDVRATIRNNVFALNVSNGVASLPADRGVSMIFLDGEDFTFSDNVITTDSGGVVLRLYKAVGGVVTGNRLDELRTSGAPWALELWDSRGNTVTGNTLRTAAGTNPVIHFEGTCSNNTVAGNVLEHE